MKLVKSYSKLLLIALCFVFINSIIAYATVAGNNYDSTYSIQSGNTSIGTLYARNMTTTTTRPSWTTETTPWISGGPVLITLQRRNDNNSNFSNIGTEQSTPRCASNLQGSDRWESSCPTTTRTFSATQSGTFRFRIRNNGGGRLFNTGRIVVSGPTR